MRKTIQMKKSIYFLSAITIFLLLTPNVFSKLNGSPGAKTGSPMDGNNCTACHSGTANTGSGILSVATNIPVQGYTAGQTYAITVQMIQSSISRFGFEITCEEGNSGSAKTGSFGITDNTNTKFVNNNNAVTHTLSGNTSNVWSMNWTAPQTSVSGGVVFFVSAIAANSNGNNSGDEVYTTSRSFPEAAPTSISETHNKITAFVNPISKDIMINAVEPIYISNLEVYDISAKLVYSKKEVLLPSTINVDFLDAGIYILNMQTRGGEIITKKVILP